MLDQCLEWYTFLFGNDDWLHACMYELGVPLTKQPEFHEFDVHGNALPGMMTTHLIASFISMHHLDKVGPFFPRYNLLNGVLHLVIVMRIEPCSVLQRCICYDLKKKLTILI